MKIAYNSARAGVSNVAPLAAMRRYIAGLDGHPTQLALFAELIAPTIMPDHSGTAFTQKKVFPTMFRSAVTQLLAPGGDRVLTRIVGVNSFFFHIMVPAEPMTLEEFEDVESQLVTHINGTVRVDPEAHVVNLATSPQDGISSFLPHMNANWSQYREYFARKRRGK